MGQTFSLEDGFQTPADSACRELVAACQRGERCAYRAYGFKDHRELRSYQVTLAAHRRAAAKAGQFGPLCFAMRAYEGDLYIWTVPLTEIAKWWKRAWDYLPAETEKK